MTDRHRFLARPLFRQVRDELAERIASGMWKAGALLPNEVHLASEFGVSPGTMRKALDLLESERIVSRQQGRGTTVVDHDTDEMAIRFSSIFNQFDQRISGHVTFCNASFDKPTEDEQRKLRLSPSEVIARAKRIRSYHDHPFMYEEVVLACRHFKGFDLGQFENARLSAIAQRHGIVLSHAKERVSPVLCPAERLADLNLSDPIPILLLNRVTFSSAGLPLELRTAWCHLRDKHYMSITT